MAPIIDERAFEASIEQSLIANGGYIKGDAEDFDCGLAIDSKALFQFIKDTQKETWDSLTTIHGAEVEKSLCIGLIKN